MDVWYLYLYLLTWGNITFNQRVGLHQPLHPFPSPIGRSLSRYRRWADLSRLWCEGLRGSVCVTLWSPQRWLLRGNACACSSCICSRPPASISRLLTGTRRRRLPLPPWSVLVLVSPTALIFDCWPMWIQQLFPQPQSCEELCTQTLTFRSVHLS